MIFITGGTGLVGSHILLKLSQRNISFKALKRERSSLDVCKDVFTYYNAESQFNKIKWVNGDVNDIPSLEEGMKNCTKVIHAAAIVSFHNDDEEIIYKINVEGTINIVNVALSAGIEKLSYISSIAALGRNTTSDIVDENCDFKISKKENNYSLSKYYSEQEVWRASQEGLDVVILNPSVILGPGDWTKGSSQIFQKIYDGLKYYTSGSTGYVDVTDVSECAIKLLESDIKNERFIINGANLKFRELFDMIAERFNKKKATIKVTLLMKELAWRIEFFRSFITGRRPLITKETANSSMKISSYSTKKIENAISFKFIPIEESVEKYCQWFSEKI
ncbi:MAG: NAD-dependent epimerase/dehydratase family protein [Flavobacteriales bacterium]|nr:NAD-dependent epimerase/dehydratase family protein [Flavobacteriales bacterium]